LFETAAPITAMLLLLLLLLLLSITTFIFCIISQLLYSSLVAATLYTGQPPFLSPRPYKVRK